MNINRFLVYCFLIFSSCLYAFDKNQFDIIDIDKSLSLIVLLLQDENNFTYETVARFFFFRPTNT